MNGRPDVLVLDASVNLVEAGDIAPDVRHDLGMGLDEVAVEGPGERSYARVVSASTAALLRQFSTPRTVDAAIFDLNRAVGGDPFELLEAAVPVLDSLIAAGVLVHAGSDQRSDRPARLSQGDDLAGFRLVRAVRDLSDTQVFQAGSDSGRLVALKVVAPDAMTGGQSPLRHEAAMHRLAAGRGVPDVAACGTEAGHDYVATDWVEGIPVTLRANEIRAGARRTELVRLCRSVVLAFARLHALGIVHGDVRPSNVLVDRSDEVWIIDFGLAFRCGELPPRRSMEFATLEPEAARSVLAGHRPRTPTLASEQYAIGALLRSMVTGTDPVALRPVASDMLAALAAGTIAPFTSAGTPPWPSMEAVLDRALAAQPADRFRSLDELAAELRHVEIPQRSTRRRTVDGTRIVDATLDMLVSARPTPGRGINVHDGAAGAAWFLYRAALIREEPDLLAAADIHLERVHGHRPAPVHRCAVLHDVSGVVAISLLVASARGDRVSTMRHANELTVLVADSSDAEPELFAGRAGRLCALATARQAFETTRCPSSMAAAIDELGCDLTTVAVGLDAPPDRRGVAHLGMAHGVAGILHGLTVAGVARAADAVLRAATDLAARAVPIGRGSAWPGTIVDGHTPRTADFAPGWCAGSAGMIHFFTELEDRTAGGLFGSTVTSAAWHCFEHPDGSPQLCCGLAGRAIALGRAYRATGDELWLDRAETLLVRALRRWGGTAEGLFRGDLGVALAALELERPETSTMPLLGPQPHPPT